MMKQKRFKINTSEIGNIYIDNLRGEHMSWAEVEKTLNRLYVANNKLFDENKELKKENENLKFKTERNLTLDNHSKKEIAKRVVTIYNVIHKYLGKSVFKNDVNPNDAVNLVLEEILLSEFTID